MTRLPPRPIGQRKLDTTAKLDAGGDAWLATASPAGEAHLVPLSAIWDGDRLIFAVPTGSVTAGNVTATRRARVAFGPTRDVVMLDVDLDQVVPTGDAPDNLAETFAQRIGWDPREDADYSFLTLRPRRIQAWREANELAGRTLMRDGAWLA
jgi:hypothetical protein